MSGDGPMDIVKFNAETFRFDNKLFDFVLEEVGFLVFCRGRAIGNNRSGALTDFQQARIDEAGYDLVRGVRIDFEFAAEDADRRKIVTRTESATHDGFGGSVDDLLVQRRARSELDVERNHFARTITDSTEQARMELVRGPCASECVCLVSRLA